MPLKNSCALREFPVDWPSELLLFPTRVPHSYIYIQLNDSIGPEEVFLEKHPYPLTVLNICNIYMCVCVYLQ